MKRAESMPSLKLMFIAYFAPVTTQAEDLSKYFKDQGAKVLCSSRVKNVFLRALDMAFHLIRDHARYDTVIIQSHSYAHFLYTVWALFWTKILRKKYIIMYLGGAAPQFFKDWGKSIAWVFEAADAVVVGSKFLEDEFKTIGIHATVIPAVIKLSEWKYKERKKYSPHLLWVRHLRPEYNPAMAVEVVSSLRKRGLHAKLMFVGSNPLQKELEMLSDKLKVKPFVAFSGRVHPGQLQKYYNDHDIFINTTHVDNQPRSVLEAQACGLPVISTNVGGCPYIITHGRNGYLVDDGDSGAMSHCVEEIILHPASGRKMAKTALEDLRQYEWSAIKDQWSKLFFRL